MVVIRAGNEWSDAQINWLDRLAHARNAKVVLDDDVFITRNFHLLGGKPLLNTTLDYNTHRSHTIVRNPTSADADSVESINTCVLCH
ncbi:hypothetical protein, partial [Salmonella enterica]|uniref:hypothetical protein n=1 Tax=Salmonella enterica TaxID=28901 RepID=UPI00398C3405